MEKTAKTYYTSSVSPKGQITLPKQLRDELQIEPKDVVVIVLEDGKIQIESAKARLRSVYQSVPALDTPIEWSDLTKAVWEEFGEQHAQTGLSNEDPA
jgi:AbrB family looped-hinge helix DNA binding protein